MKNAILSALLFVMFTACSTETDVVASDVPPAVKAAFEAKYPDAENTEWEVQKKNDELIFEAEFKTGGREREAHFKSDGTFMDED